MTIQEARQGLIRQLSSIYDTREAANIADWVLEHLTGLKKIDRLVHRDRPLTEEQSTLLHSYTTQLLTHRPVQYVLQEAWFAGLRLYVDEQVLIPRPETEELVAWVVEESRKREAGSRKSEVGSRRAEDGSWKPEVGSQRPELRILDIGTGSGCIPIALKKQLPEAILHACDVSAGALQVAQRNAAAHAVPIQFHLLDILQEVNWNALPAVDILVSNPPYIPLQDQATMRDNVLQHEPHLALFVANDDPLLFYRTIAAFAQQRLPPGGKIYVEIHEALGAAVVELFTQYGLGEVVLKQDMQGKDRMVRAMKI